MAYVLDITWMTTDGRVPGLGCGGLMGRRQRRPGLGCGGLMGNSVVELALAAGVWWEGRVGASQIYGWCSMGDHTGSSRLSEREC